VRLACATPTWHFLADFYLPVKLPYFLLPFPFAQAERYYIKAGMAIEAVDMYSRAGRWEAAQKVARGYLGEGEMRAFYKCVIKRSYIPSCTQRAE
jgi:hypothetical protein